MKLSLNLKQFSNEHGKYDSVNESGVDDVYYTELYIHGGSHATIDLAMNGELTKGEADLPYLRLLSPNLYRELYGIRFLDAETAWDERFIRESDIAISSKAYISRKVEASNELLSFCYMKPSALYHQGEERRKGSLFESFEVARNY